MKIKDILENYVSGDENSWATEFQRLWTTEHEYMAVLAADILRNGFQDPVMLGDDGRVWDGHHRLAIGWAFLYAEIPALPRLDPYWDNYDWRKQ